MTDSLQRKGKLGYGIFSEETINPHLEKITPTYKANSHPKSNFYQSPCKVIFWKISQVPPPTWGGGAGGADYVRPPCT